MPDWLFPNFTQLPAFLLDNLGWAMLGAAIVVLTVIGDAAMKRLKKGRR